MAGNSVRFKSSLAGATNTRVLMDLPTCTFSLEFYGKQKEAEVGFRGAWVAESMDTVFVSFFPEWEASFCAG